MAIFVVGNDFDESLLAYKRDASFHRYAELPDGTLTLVRSDFTPSSRRDAIKASALAGYLSSS